MFEINKYSADAEVSNPAFFHSVPVRSTQTRATSSTATQQGSTWVSPWWISSRSASGYQKACLRRIWKRRLKTRVRFSSTGCRSSFLIHSIWSDIPSVLYLCPRATKLSIMQPSSSVCFGWTRCVYNAVQQTTDLSSPVHPMDFQRPDDLQEVQ